MNRSLGTSSLGQLDENMLLMTIRHTRASKPVSRHEGCLSVCFHADMLRYPSRCAVCCLISTSSTQDIDAGQPPAQLWHLLTDTTQTTDHATPVEWTLQLHKAMHCVCMS